MAMTIKNLRPSLIIINLIVFILYFGRDFIAIKAPIKKLFWRASSKYFLMVQRIYAPNLKAFHEYSTYLLLKLNI